MPLFTQYSTSSRDLRVLPSFASPLPRLTPAFDPVGSEEKYEVLIAGVSIHFCSLPSTRRDLQDDIPSTGRYRILILISTDLLPPTGRSSTTITYLSTLLKFFPRTVLELVVLHCLPSSSFLWKDIPASVKAGAEMSFYNATELEDVYAIYGVERERGAVVVVRPDGYIGLVDGLREGGAGLERGEKFLRGFLKVVDGASEIGNGEANRHSTHD